MTNHRNRFPARRKFLKQSAALSAGAAIPATVVVVASASARPPEPAPTPDPRRKPERGSSR